MFKKKTDLAIVNRGFWPQSQVIGEALLQLAETCSIEQKVAVITQSEDGCLRQRMDQSGRGQGVRVMDCRSRSDSSTKLIRRSCDALIFMMWTFFSLIKSRPAKVYVSTNPPVVVPFIVMLYCKLFGASYYYHLQDIHPEAANVVVRLNPLMSRLLIWLDCLTMRHAERLVTLSEDMRHYILKRSNTSVEIELLDNPSFPAEVETSADRDGDVVFCGNAGRLQRIPLLLEAISGYLEQGGRLSFTFAGAGLHAPQIAALANDHESVTYHGLIPAPQAAAVVNRHRWALLPIDDEVTRYAFPSKSSAYVLAGCQILAICGRDTSVARWVEAHGVGLAAEPDKQSIIATLWQMEASAAVEPRQERAGGQRVDLKARLSFSYFNKRLCSILGLDLASKNDDTCSQSTAARGASE